MEKNRKFLVRILNLYRAMPLELKASMYFFVCNMIQNALSVVSTVIFTRLLSTEDYGVISVYQSWQNILYVIVTLNLATGIYNIGMTKYKKDQDEYTFSLQILGVVITSVISILMSVTYTIWNKWLEMSSTIFAATVLFFLFVPSYRLWSAKQRYKLQYRSLVAVTIIESVFSIVISFIVVCIANDKAQAKIITGIFVTTAISVILFIDNMKKAHFRVDVHYWKEAFLYNLNMMPAFLSMIFFNQIDRVMIDSMESTSKAGMYSVAYNGAMIIMAINNAFGAVYNPWLIKKIDENKKKLKIDTISNVGAIFLGTITLFTLVAPELIKIIASEEYYEAIYVMPPVSASVFFMFIYHLYSPFVQYYMKPKFLSLLNIIIALLNVILNYFFISKYGYLAAAYTTLVCYILYGWMTAIYAHYLQNKYNSKITYDTKALIVMSAICVLSSVIISWIYRYIYIRYILIALVLLAFVFGKKGIVSVIKEFK